MHPSDGRIEAYARRTLGPDDLLEVDDHLASCAPCRARAAALAGMDDAIGNLPGGLLPPESHLSDEQVIAFAGGTLDALQRTYAAGHLRVCAACAREAADLGAWVRGRRRSRWPAYAAAAAVLALVAVPVILGTRASGLPGLQSLPPEHRDRVRAALEAGVAEPPAHLAQLRGRPEALMGEQREERFGPIEPLETVTVSDRPAFRWRALEGANAYTVTVADEGLGLVTQSPPVPATEWAPTQPLPRGGVYVWQVTAQRGSESVSAPVPPAPWAKFRVMEEETARPLERLAREHPDSHLLLGILSAQAGARAEALAHLARVPASDPHYETARRTMARLEAGAP
jgi:hypothetical protein